MATSLTSRAPTHPKTAGSNNHAERDACAGFKADFGWLPQERITSFSAGTPAQSALVDTRAAASSTVFHVGALDTGSLDRGTVGPSTMLPTLSLAWAHPTAWSTDLGDRRIYASFRSRSVAAEDALVLNDVPSSVGIVGHSRLIDTTPYTSGLSDGHLRPGDAMLLPAADGVYMLHHLGAMQQPLTSADRRDRVLRIRAGRLTRYAAPVRNVSASSAVTLPPDGLGCFLQECQPMPLATAISLLCNATAATAAQPLTTSVSVSVIGSAVALNVTVSDASPQAGAAVTATLCAPAGLSASGLVQWLAYVELSLAAYESEAMPIPELLAGSRMDRGNEVSDSEVPFAAAGATAGFNTSCRSATWFAADAAAATIVAARVQLLELASASSIAYMRPAQLTLSCTPSTAGAVSDHYGVPKAAASSSSLALDFGTGSGSLFTGIYSVSATNPFLGGAPFYELSGSFALGYSSSDGAWMIFDAALTGYYKRQPQAAPPDLSKLIAFDDLPFVVTPVCPSNSYWYKPGNGCLACPANSRCRRGASVASLEVVSTVCTCKAGLYMALTDSGTDTSASVRFACVPCPANTYKDRAGNDANDSEGGCRPCPPGYFAEPGALRCSAASASALTVQANPSGTTLPLRGFARCDRFALAGWQPAWTGVYSLYSDPTPHAASSAATGAGRLVYVLESTAQTAAPIYLVHESVSQRWAFTSKPSTVDVFLTRVTSGRPPWAWGTEEFTANYPAARARCICSTGEKYNDTGCTCPEGQGTSAQGVCMRCPSGTTRSISELTALPAGGICTACPDFMTTDDAAAIWSGESSLGSSLSSGSIATSCPLATCGAFTLRFTVAPNMQGLLPASFSGNFTLNASAAASLPAPAGGLPRTFVMYKVAGPRYIWWTGTRWTLDSDLEPSLLFGYHSGSSAASRPWTLTTGWFLWFSGAWQPANATVTCTAGINGKFWNAQGIGGALNSCPAGTSPPSDMPAATVAGCTACAPGYARDGLGACVACPVDTYSPGDGASCSACPVGRSTQGATAQAACSCASGFSSSSASSSAACVDIDECSAGNGGCSHVCRNLQGGFMCSCPNGWGLATGSSKQCAPCTDQETVDPGSGRCVGCGSGSALIGGILRRSIDGNGCACPFGALWLHTDSRCARPAEVRIRGVQVADSSITVASSVIAQMPIQGSYLACRLASGGATAPAGTMAWRRVQQVNVSASPTAPLFLSYDPLSASWAVLSSQASRWLGSWPDANASSLPAAPAARHAFVESTGLTLHNGWLSSGATTVGMLPVGRQDGWQVFLPPPLGFTRANITLEASSNTAIADETALPLCDAAFAAPLPDAAVGSASSTLGSGPGMLAPDMPSASPTAGTLASPSRTPVSATRSNTATGTPASSRTGTASATASGTRTASTSGQRIVAAASLVAAASPTATKAASASASMSRGSSQSSTTVPSHTQTKAAAAASAPRTGTASATTFTSAVAADVSLQLTLVLQRAAPHSLQMTTTSGAGSVTTTVNASVLAQLLCLSTTAAAVGVLGKPSSTATLPCIGVGLIGSPLAVVRARQLLPAAASGTDLSAPSQSTGEDSVLVHRHHDDDADSMENAARRATGTWSGGYCDVMTDPACGVVAVDMTVQLRDTVTLQDSSAAAAILATAAPTAVPLTAAPALAAWASTLANNTDAVVAAAQLQMSIALAGPSAASLSAADSAALTLAAQMLNGAVLVAAPGTQLTAQQAATVGGSAVTVSPNPVAADSSDNSLAVGLGVAGALLLLLLLVVLLVVVLRRKQRREADAAIARQPLTHETPAAAPTAAEADSQGPAMPAQQVSTGTGSRGRPIPPPLSASRRDNHDADVDVDSFDLFAGGGAAMPVRGAGAGGSLSSSASTMTTPQAVMRRGDFPPLPESKTGPATGTATSAARSRQNGPAPGSGAIVKESLAARAELESARAQATGPTQPTLPQSARSRPPPEQKADPGGTERDKPRSRSKSAGRSRHEGDRSLSPLGATAVQIPGHSKVTAAAGTAHTDRKDRAKSTGRSRDRDDTEAKSAQLGDKAEAPPVRRRSRSQDAGHAEMPMGAASSTVDAPPAAEVQQAQRKSKDKSRGKSKSRGRDKSRERKERRHSSDGRHDLGGASETARSSEKVSSTKLLGKLGGGQADSDSARAARGSLSEEEPDTAAVPEPPKARAPSASAKDPSRAVGPHSAPQARNGTGTACKGAAAGTSSHALDAADGILSTVDEAYDVGDSFSVVLLQRAMQEHAARLSASKATAAAPAARETPASAHQPIVLSLDAAPTSARGAGRNVDRPSIGAGMTMTASRLGPPHAQGVPTDLFPLSSGASRGRVRSSGEAHSGVESTIAGPGRTPALPPVLGSLPRASHLQDRGLGHGVSVSAPVPVSVSKDGVAFARHRSRSGSRGRLADADESLGMAPAKERSREAGAAAVAPSVVHRSVGSSATGSAVDSHGRGESLPGTVVLMASTSHSASIAVPSSRAPGLSAGASVAPPSARGRPPAAPLVPVSSGRSESFGRRGRSASGGLSEAAAAPEMPYPSASTRAGTERQAAAAASLSGAGPEERLTISPIEGAGPTRSRASSREPAKGRERSRSASGTDSAAASSGPGVALALQAEAGVSRKQVREPQTIR